ncbi:hypothetical protein [Pseudonocardia phyllosphaerae]|uniref:hypothetical protein n=1 Tax=Pseudonocardia phyllosphaerae TaxID=3390502 RepID=UPI0039797A48
MSARAWALVAVLLVAVGIVAGVGWKSAYSAPSGTTTAAAPPGLPATGAGNQNVVLSADAAAHPAATLVRDRMQLYFNAINTRDHATWSQVVDPERVVKQSREEWLAGVGTTQDGTIRIDRIDPDEGGGVLALVRFVSTQDPKSGPPGLQVGRICWYATYPMAGSPPRIRAGDTASMSTAGPC